MQIIIQETTEMEKSKARKWWDEECKKETKRRNKLRIRALQTQQKEHHEEYRQ